MSKVMFISDYIHLLYTKKLDLEEGYDIVKNKKKFKGIAWLTPAERKKILRRYQFYIEMP